jgi:hypothetical protein
LGNFSDTGVTSAPQTDFRQTNKALFVLATLRLRVQCVNRGDKTRREADLFEGLKTSCLMSTVLFNLSGA